MTIRSSVGNRGVNQFADVMLVQKLLNSQKGTAYTFGLIAEDGLVGSQTIGAITDYQKNVVKLSLPDGRVDPGGQTIKALVRNANRSPVPNPPQPPAAPGTGLFSITFRHSEVVPTPSGAGMYESTVSMAGPKSATFRGSIYPDDMNEKGRIKDGTYTLSLVFHHKVGVPTAADLVVKTQGDLRPALTVNYGGIVPAISNNPSKTTSQYINVHNGFNSNRGSHGCLTIQPSEWSKFITIFLNLYPNLDDWYGNGSWRGREIGTLHVRA
jgi:hypothetical protein